MKRKSLFNEYEAQNEDGVAVGDNVRDAVTELLDWLAEKFSIRDIETVAKEEIHQWAAEKRLREAIDTRWKQRMQRKEGKE